jgi:hypothetical protein
MLHRILLSSDLIDELHRGVIDKRLTGAIIGELIFDTHPQIGGESTHDVEFERVTDGGLR